MLSLVTSGATGSKHVVVLAIHSLAPTITLDPDPIEQLSTHTLVFSFSAPTIKHPWFFTVDLQSVAAVHVAPKVPFVKGVSYLSYGITGFANAMHSVFAIIVYDAVPTLAISFSVTNLQIA
jgi:hypothetical protein